MNSPRVRWWIPLVAIGAAWILALVGGCTARGPVPMTLRPDTRHIILVSLDTAALEKALTLFRVSAPNEASICWYGKVKPLLKDGEEWLQVDVEGFNISAADSVSEYHVFYPRGIPGGCVGDYIGLSHSHTHSGHFCTHSYDDAAVLFSARKALFSIVFCYNGDAELLYQDGRRVHHEFAP